MFEGQYCRIINRFTRKVIASGKIINHKEIPVKCITFDNRYFFNINSLLYKFCFCNNCEEIKFDYIKYRNKIKLWKDSNKRYSFVYREYDIVELDKEVEFLVNIINNISDINLKTVSSCSGHDKSRAWVDIYFEDFCSLKAFVSILDKNEFKKKFVLTTDENIINSNRKGIYLSLKTTTKGKEAYKDMDNLAYYLKKVFNLE